MFLLRKSMLAVLTACLIVGSVAADSPYSKVMVNQGDGSYAETLCWPNHLEDTPWVQEADYLDRPQVALDGNATKYGTLGPDNAGSWTVYVWAGYRMVQDTPYEVSALAYGPGRVVGTQPDGTVFADTVIQANETLTWTFYANPATTAQWRTKGYKLEVTAVPEPCSLLGFSSMLLSIVVLRRRLR